MKTVYLAGGCFWGTQKFFDQNDIAAQIEVVVKEFNRGHSTRKTAEKYGIDPKLAEQIIRLYVTHPGVTTEGIMTKMGL